MSQPILDYIAQYIKLETKEEEYFLSVLKPRKYLRRQFVVQAGDECKYETFVISGCLKAYFIDPDGNNHIIQFAIENWWISDMDSLMNGTPATLNIDAVEDTEVLQIERKDFDTLFERIPKFNTLYRMMLMKAFISHQRRIVDNLCKPAKDRYLDFVKRYRNIEQRVPQHQIASYLGMTPEFLSQIRRKLSSKS
jgi:CRP-like cAMP-binding protein